MVAGFQIPVSQTAFDLTVFEFVDNFPTQSEGGGALHPRGMIVYVYSFIYRLSLYVFDRPFHRLRKQIRNNRTDGEPVGNPPKRRTLEGRETLLALDPNCTKSLKKIHEHGTNFVKSDKPATPAPEMGYRGSQGALLDESCLPLMGRGLPAHPSRSSWTARSTVGAGRIWLGRVTGGSTEGGSAPGPPWQGARAS